MIHLWIHELARERQQELLAGAKSYRLARSVRARNASRRTAFRTNVLAALLWRAYGTPGRSGAYRTGATGLEAATSVRRADTTQTGTTRKCRLEQALARISWRDRVVITMARRAFLPRGSISLSFGSSPPSFAGRSLGESFDRCQPLVPLRRDARHPLSGGVESLGTDGIAHLTA